MAHEGVRTALVLPVTVVSRTDVARLYREMEAIANAWQQADLSKEKLTPVSPVSVMLEEIMQVNHLNMSEPADRQQLQQALLDLKKTAPSIHISFAVVPPAAFTTRLVTWLRKEIHPLLLLDIGLQPTIAAGCIIRTTNKYFDCSIRQHLLSNRPKLVEMIREKAA